MAKDASEESAVDVSTGRGPTSISGNNNDREKHKSKSICTSRLVKAIPDWGRCEALTIDRAQATHVAQGITVSNQEAKRVSRLRRSEEVRPPVQTTSSRHCRA